MYTNDKICDLGEDTENFIALKSHKSSIMYILGIGTGEDRGFKPAV